jgi:hypothetical protein
MRNISWQENSTIPPNQEVFKKNQSLGQINRGIYDRNIDASCDSGKKASPSLAF